MQRLDFGGAILRQRKRAHARAEERLGLIELQDHHTLDAENDEIHLVLVRPRHLLNDRLGADGVQVVGGRGHVLGRVALRHHDDLFLFGRERGLGGGERRGPADCQRHEQIREQHAVLQRQQR